MSPTTLQFLLTFASWTTHLTEENFYSDSAVDYSNAPFFIIQQTYGHDNTKNNIKCVISQNLERYMGAEMN